MKNIIAILIIGLSFSIANAQVINICGADTIILQVENYNNGIIEWQESIDTLTWMTIPETTGTTYKFLPTQNKFYRALVKTSTCEPLPSSITQVQLPPQANAGNDRIIGGTSITLSGNKINGAKGKWKIISGDGGNILDETNPNSEFSGSYNQKYQLSWSLSNTCGQSSDTVNVKFEEIITTKNFIIIDNTDQILSDSIEMANGIYKIKFSDLNINPTDSIMLIGIRNDLSFLRKVSSFSFDGRSYIFNTTQGTFEDLFKSGSLNLGDAINQSIIKGNLKSSNVFPTRNSLAMFSDNKGIKVIYYQYLLDDNIHLPKLKSTARSDALMIQLPDMTIFKSDDGSFSFSISNSYISITPNFVSDYTYSFPSKIKDIRIGLDNAQIDYSFKTKIEASKAISFVGLDKTITKLSATVVVMVGALPVSETANFEIKASLNINSSASVSLEQQKHYTTTLNAMVVGKDLRNIEFISSSNKTSTSDEKFITKGKMTGEFKFGPEVSFKTYDFVGPYFNLPIKLKTELCINNNLNWDANVSLSLSGQVGAKANLFGYDLFDFNYKLFNSEAIIKYPNKLELLSGNSQKGKSGEVLPNPISFKVLSSLGTGVPFVPVRFELDNGDGSIKDDLLYTNSLGQVSTDWTLGSNNICKLKAYVLDCNNSDIENSPMIITASETSPCTNSNFQVLLDKGQIYAYGGTVPYMYSINGIDYSSKPPVIASSGKYKVYIKDKNNCTIQRSISINPSSLCDKSDLGLDIFNQANTLQLIGKKGTPPYQYAIDNQNNFSINNYYSNLSAGTHMAFVRDANNCIYSYDISVKDQGQQAIIAVNPINGANYIATTGINFEWRAGNYAIGQGYDIYLRKNNESYIQVAKNISTLKYSHTGILSNNTTYTWKVVVKDNNGIEKDFREFTFITASTYPTTPIVPTLLSPSNGSISATLPVTLKWSSQEGNFKYDVYLDETNATRLIVNNSTKSELNVDNLIVGKKYYWKVRIKSMITDDFKESPIWSFTPVQISEGTVTDIDGNVYHTVAIGTQTWMVENLKTTKCNDGTIIPNVIDGFMWGRLDSPGYCWYNNDISNKNIYGALYNWNAVKTGKLAPKGWHVATDRDWTILEDFLGGWQSAASKIVETGTTHWFITNNKATNETGFTALPGGYRIGSLDLIFAHLGDVGAWWCSDLNTQSLAWYRAIESNDTFSSLERDGDGGSINWGLSVRCIKD